MTPEKIDKAQQTADRFGTPITIIQANYKADLTWQVSAELAGRRAEQCEGTCVLTLLPNDWFDTTIIEKITSSDYNAGLFAPSFWASFEV